MEAQLAELQRKYRIMQGDKQAYAESSSLTLRKQRCAVPCFEIRAALFNGWIAGPTSTS